jgi:hypothetical protein
VIWSVNYLHTHQLVPDRLRSLLDDEGANVFAVEMLCQGVATERVIFPGLEGLIAWLRRHYSPRV